MKPVARIIKNTGVEVVSNVFNMLLSAVFTFFIARAFGPGLYGTFSIVTTFPLFFTSFMLFGLDCILIRDIARDKNVAGKILCNAILFQILLAAITFLFISVTIAILGYDSNMKGLINLFFFFCIITSITTVNSTSFKAFERMEFNSILNTGEKVLVLVLGIAAIMNSYRVRGIIIIFIIAGLIKLAVSILITFRKFTKWDMTVDTNIWKYFLKEGYPVAVSSFFTSFRWNIVILVISRTLTESDAGFYNAAFKLTYPILLITFAYSTAILPMMSVFHDSSREKLVRIYKVSCKLAMAITIPVSIFITFYSDDIVRIILGDKYTSSIDVLRIVIWILPFSFLVYPLGNVLVSVNHQKDTMVINGVNAALLFVCEIVLTEKYGLLGACAGIVAAEALLAVMYFYCVTLRFRYISIAEFLLKPTVSGLGMAAVIIMSSGAGKVISGIAGLIVYVAIAYFSKVFSSNEVEKVREALSI